jgi:hypothetical protein
MGPFNREVAAMAKRLIGCALAVAVYACGGRAEAGFVVEPRGDVEVSYADVEFAASVPVHPDDTGTTPVRVELSEGLLSPALKGGLFAGYRILDRVDLLVGGEIRLNGSALDGSDGYRQDPYEVQRFTEHAGASYAYVQLQGVNWYNLIPSVELRAALNDDGASLGVSYSFYETEYEVEAGWDRFGRFQPYVDETLSGDTQRWTLCLRAGRGHALYDVANLLEAFFETADFADSAIGAEHWMLGFSVGRAW